MRELQVLSMDQRVKMVRGAHGWLRECVDGTRENCTVMEAELMALLEKARELLDRCTTKGCFQNDPVVDAFLDKTSAPAPKPSAADAPIPRLEKRMDGTLSNTQIVASIDALADAVEQLQRDVHVVLDPTGH